MNSAEQLEKTQYEQEERIKELRDRINAIQRNQLELQNKADVVCTCSLLISAGS